MKNIGIASVCQILLWIPLQGWAQFVPPRILKHDVAPQTRKVDILNSRYRETNLSISPDGKYLFFMSGRGEQPWSTPFYTSYRGKPEHDGDIWYATSYGAGLWNSPICLGGNINTEAGEDEPNISPDGQRMAFQSWRGDWSETGGPYYATKLDVNGRWTDPIGLGGGITQFFKDKEIELSKPTSRGTSLATDGATLSADGKTFIVAFGTDYQGDMDLFISRKDAQGNWGYLKRLQASSFVGNERSPFLASDGRTLYFASDGYAGWGGLDILKTEINEDNSHTEIINIGSPFNTVQDDYGLLLTADGNSAYFVRDGDIYYADITALNPEMKPVVSFILTGKVTDASNGKSLSGAAISLLDPTLSTIITQALSNQAGDYSLVIPTDAITFLQAVNQQGYVTEEKQHNLVDRPVEANIVKVDIALKPLSKQENPVISQNKPEDAACDMGINPR